MKPQIKLHTIIEKLKYTPTFTHIHIKPQPGEKSINNDDIIDNVN